MKEAPEYLRRSEAANYLKARWGMGSTAWLAKLAVIGGGPVYSKAGKIPLYLKADIDDWMRFRMTRRASTSVRLDDSPTSDSDQSNEATA